jgi:N-glycosylase/DNA lyase
MQNVQELKQIYKKIKPQIVKKIVEFKTVWNDKSQKKIFAELVFCLLTPQSKAKVCWNCVENIIKKNLLLKNDYKKILSNLVGVRFKYKKTNFITNVQKLFVKNNHLIIKDTLGLSKNVFQTREWLVKNVKGMGLKEASHFLRNIGFGKNIAILDRHILRNLKSYNVIKKIPKSLTKKVYYSIENKMQKFAKKIKIPMEHLDFVFWYKDNKEIFK